MNETKRNDPAVNTISQIIQSREDGFGIIPLIGAGFSVPSGVPVINEINVYLKQCILLAIGIDNKLYEAISSNNISEHQIVQQFTPDHRNWMPGQDQWPPYSQSTIGNNDLASWDLVFESLLRSLRREKKTHLDIYKVIKEGFGSSSDWRSMLLFISRLSFRFPDSIHDDRKEETATSARRKKKKQSTPAIPSDKKNEVDYSICLGAPNLNIVDSFFLNVVSEKKCNLGHKLLAQLSRPLGINIILTTNFDNLIESGYRENGNDLTVYDVHINSGLPSFSDMMKRRSLIKLHGGRYGLRADYSLETAPSDEDSKHFISYFYGSVLRNDVWLNRETKLDSKSHLLCMGVSGSDRRVLTLIKSCFERLRDFKLYWICFSESDFNNTENSLKTYLKDLYDSKKIVLLQHRVPSLFLLRCYQGLTRSFPSENSIFPNIANIPFPTRYSTSIRDKNGIRIQKLEKKEEQRITTIADKLDIQFEKIKQTYNSKTRFVKLFSVFADRKHVGISQIGKALFEKYLNDGYEVIWVDMDEISCSYNLFEVILQSIINKHGLEGWFPTIVNAELDDDQIAQSWCDELNRIIRYTNKKYKIILNGRCRTGGIFVQDDSYDQFKEEYPNGWLDFSLKHQEQSKDYVFDDSETNNFESFWKLAESLSGCETRNVDIILLCFGESNYANALKKSPVFFPNPINVNEFDETKGSDKDQTIHELTENITQYIDDIELNANKFGMESFADLSLLVKHLTEHTRPIDAWIHGQLAEKTKDKMARYKVTKSNAELLQKLLFQDLNSIIAGSSIYKLSLFRDVELRKRTRELKQHHPRENNLERLNRMLIEDAYPEAISRNGNEHFAKKHYLFSLVLCNRTRYPSILWSYPFQINDLSTRERVELSDKLLLDLEDKYFIGTKPGGFIWMHCDIRNQMREELRRLFTKGEELEFHKAIGYWYYKFFLSSRDPIAAFESVYHVVEVVDLTCYLLRNERSISNEHKEMLMDRVKICFLDILTTLKLALRSCLNYENSKQACKYIQQIRDEKLSYIERDSITVIDQIDEGKYHEILIIINKIREWTTIMNFSIALEVGANQTAYKRLKESRAWQTVQYQWELMNPAKRRTFPFDKKQKIYDSLIDDSMQMQYFGPGYQDSKFFKHVPSNVRALHYIKYVTIGIATRSSRVVEGGLDVLKQIIQFDTLKNRFYDYDKPEQLQKHVEMSLKGEDEIKDLQRKVLDRIYLTIKLISRNLQWEIYKIHLSHGLRWRMYLVKGIVDGENDGESNEHVSDFEKKIDKGRTLFRLGLALIELFQKNLANKSKYRNRNDFKYIDKTLFYRQKFETMDAMLLAFKGDFGHGLRRVSEATGTKRNYDDSRGSIEESIIDLHRAELLTMNALHNDMGRTDSKAINDQDNLTLLGKFRRMIIAELYCQSESNSIIQTKEKNTLKNHYFDSVKAKLSGILRDSDKYATLKMCLTKIDEAWFILSRAEGVLKQKRKNVWWTAWYFDQKLKLIELDVIGKCLEVMHQLKSARSRRKQNDMTDDLRIPHIGFEAVPVQCDTIVETLLEDCDRMVSYDVYRNMRVLESFSNICVAFGLFCNVYGEKRRFSEAELLFERYYVYIDKLEKYKANLNSKIENRDKTDAGKEGFVIDSDLVDYWEYLKKYTHHVKNYSLMQIKYLKNDYLVKE